MRVHDAASHAAAVYRRLQEELVEGGPHVLGLVDGDSAAIVRVLQQLHIWQAAEETMMASVRAQLGQSPGDGGRDVPSE